jgi:hypothetical protein
MLRFPPWTVPAVLLLGFVPPALAQDKAAALPNSGVSYGRDVAPILRRHCVSCHTKNEPEGGLSPDAVPHEIIALVLYPPAE